MEPQQSPFVLADLRSCVERLALPIAEQVEWVSRLGLQPEKLVLDSRDAVGAAVHSHRAEFSPVLLLRLGALVDQLNFMSGEPDAMLETPDTILRHSSWALVRQLAEAALREPGWPSAWRLTRR
jgi:hypothetical protein